MRIFKYPVATPYAGIEAPANWRPVAVQLQAGLPTIWAEVDTRQPEITHLVHVVATGTPLPDEPRTYLGTVQIPGADARTPVVVWHVYEVKR